MTNTDAAYLAGLFDGEGCVHRRKDGRIHLSVANTHRPLCEAFLVFGGRVQVSEKAHGNSRTCWVWQATGKAALQTRAALGEFLRLKVIPSDVGLKRRIPIESSRIVPWLQHGASA